MTGRKLTAEAHELEDRIAQNVAELLEEGVAEEHTAVGAVEA